jgi:hypothetical protein
MDSGQHRSTTASQTMPTSSDRSKWYLIEPQFSTTRSRMHLHPGSVSAGCVTVTDKSCFDQLADVLNEPGGELGDVNA